MKFAIVGSDGTKWPSDTIDNVKRIISSILQRYKDKYKEDLIFVSGGCPKGGIDIWAEEIADELDIQKKIFKPEINQWNSKNGKLGYKARNIQIAEYCDQLLDIEYGQITKPSGGYWTMKKADELGKGVFHMEIG